MVSVQTSSDRLLTHWVPTVTAGANPVLLLHLFPLSQFPKFFFQISRCPRLHSCPLSDALYGAGEAVEVFFMICSISRSHCFAILCAIEFYPIAHHAMFPRIYTLALWTDCVPKFSPFHRFESRGTREVGECRLKFPAPGQML